jgi:ABC-2 type transport system permease protein
MNRLRSLLIKELLQIRRDRRLFGMVIGAPIVQLLIMGFAMTTDVRHIRLGIRDYDHSQQSRELARAMTASGYFQMTELPSSPTGDNRMLVSGDVSLLVVIPAGFGSELLQGRVSRVQAVVDGADSNQGVQGLNYLQRAARQFSSQIAVSPPASRQALPVVEIESRAWYNPSLDTRNYMVPGLMGLLLLLTTMVLSSMALVKEREDGTMEQLMVTPLRRWEIIAGKLLPFVLIGFIEVALALLMIRVIFHIPLKGSLLLLFGSSGLFLLTTLGLGVFVSTLVRTQQQAMMVATFFIMMPFVLLSGFVFPVHNMPPIMQTVSAIIPLRYYLIIVRGLFLKGVGFADIWPNAVILLAWGCAVLGLAILKLHKRLD